MNKLKALLICLLTTLILAACGQGGEEAIPEETTPAPPPRQPFTLDFDTPIDLYTAADMFDQAQALWDADGGELWGIPLHAPLLLGDPITRHVVANMQTPSGIFSYAGNGVYAGILGGNYLISNTAIDFDGLTWGITVLPQHTMSEDEKVDIFRVVIHEGFHAVQSQVVSGQLRGVTTSEYMRAAEPRISVLLEINALLVALRTDDAGLRHDAVRDALVIRNQRRTDHPDAAAFENMMEIAEGLAVFTEILTFDDVYALLDFYEEWMVQFTSGSGLEYFFPYFTGAMYSFLLQQSGADWQQGITHQTDLGGLLQGALDIADLPNISDIDLLQYGYAEIAPSQQAWFVEFEILQQEARAFLAGRTLFILGNVALQFGDEVASVLIPNPQGWRYLVFYGDMAIASANWRLEITGSHMRRNFRPDGVHVTFYDNIIIEDNGSRAVTPMWTLHIIGDLYEIRPTEGGGVAVARR